MPRATVTEVLKRSDRAFTDNEAHEGLLRDIYEFFMPQRNTYDPQKGGSRLDRVFDSTAISSAQRFANRMQKDLTPPFQRWFMLKAGPAVPKNQREQVNRELEEVTEIARAVFDSSDFPTASHEMYSDLGAGTGLMFILEGPDTKPIRFIAIPQAHAALDSGPWGDIDGLFMKKKMDPRLIKRQWPKADIPAELTRLIEAPSDKPQDVEITEAIYKDPDSRKWFYDVLWSDKKVRLLEDQFNSQPFVAPRWWKLAGETRGRGPMHNALPDVKTLNKVKELVLKNAAIAISGVYTAIDDGVINPDTVRIIPGAVIAVGRNGGPLGASLQPLSSNREFDVAQLIIEDLTMNIKKIMLDNQLPPIAGSVRSPTEIVERISQLAEDTGGAFGRLLNELIIPMVQRVIDILHAKRLIKFPIPIDQLLIRVQVVSPLARIQAMADVETMVNFMQIVTSFAGQEGLAMSTRIEDVFPWLADMLGVPDKLIRNKAEREELQDKVAMIAGAANQDEAIPSRGGPEIPVARAA